MRAGGTVLEDRRKDLDSERQKALLRRLVDEMSRRDVDFYYRSTSDVAAFLKQHIEDGTGMSAEERALLAGLSQRDIEVLLSLR
ncbi:MAG: hypothetical protein AAGA28_18015 [Pseudomonadota bacterium]